MYIPDHGFVRQLVRYDRKLSARWSPLKERWVICRRIPAPSRLYDVDVAVLTVEQEGGGYRCLDQRTLDILKACDTHVHGVDPLLDEVEQANAQMSQEIDKDFANHNEAWLKDYEPIIKREMADDMGAINVPKEDVWNDLDEQMGGTLEETLA